MEEDRGALVQSLIDTVNEIASISDYKCTIKKQYCNLARRLKLLTPMFEEIRDSKEVVSQETLKAFLSFMEALELAKELLRFGSESSKIYLVMEREQIMIKFHEATAQLEQALSGISYENLDISDEVKEQVELYEDLLSLYSKNEAATNPAVLRRLVDKLELTRIAELTQESLALHEMVTFSGRDPGESIEKMSMLLKKIKDFVQTKNPNMDAPAAEKHILASCSGQASTVRCH